MTEPTVRLPFSVRRWPFFYGWCILAVGTLGMVMSVPGQTIGVSAFTDPLMAALGLERTSISLAYMVGTICSALLLTRAGRFYDRFGARITATAAAGGLGVVLLYLSQVDHVSRALSSLSGSISPTLVALIVIGFGFFLLRFFGQGVMTMASANMVQKWFDARRGLATGIMNVFVPLAFSLAPLVFNKTIRRVGWSNAWLLAALVVGVGFAACAAVFYRDNPENCGLRPDGSLEGDGEHPARARQRDFTLPEARRTFPFWIFNLSLAMNALYGTAMTFHVASIFKQAGRSEAVAFGIFLPISIVGVLLGFTVGWISDHVRLKYPLMAMTGGMAMSMTGILLLSSGPGYVMVIAGNGIARGMFGLLLAVTWPRFFGRTHLGAITGFQRAWTVFFSAVGPFLFSLSLEHLGSYHAAVIACLCVTVALLAAGVRADKPPHPESTP